VVWEEGHREVASYSIGESGTNIDPRTSTVEDMSEIN
jgi:hypothetical protein